MIPLHQYQGFLVDLDGVIWEGNRRLPGALEFLEHCRHHNHPVAFLTNTVSLSRAQIVAKFARLGMDDVSTDQVFSAGSAMANYMAQRKPAARVFVVGSAGTADELITAGLTPVDDNADFVAVGVDREITFQRLKLACRQVWLGAELVSANIDRWFPEEDGPVPGAGCFKAFIEFSTSKQAFVAGKPEPQIFEQAIKWLNVPREHVLMIGDNVEVDLHGATGVNVSTCLIGSTHPIALLSCASLAELLERIKGAH
jgi:4-nitrophenyl phosphatase